MTYSLLPGLRVLEIGSMISAPYCGKLLADAGANVVKVEPPGTGEDSRRYGPWPHDVPHPERSGLYLYLNANKAGITANLETPTGRGILRQLAAKSDVVVHNVPPADMERLGLDYDLLAAEHPELVMASISPWGLSGPWRDYKAYDINLAAAGGICEGLGEAEREPLTFGTPEVGYFAGMAAASSIVMALLGRDAYGGQHIDIAEAETMAGLYNGPEALMAVYEWRVTRRTGHHALDFPYPNCILRCKDGHIFVGSPEGRQWRRLLEIMGNPEWSQEQRFRNRTAMNNLYADEVDGYLEGVAGRLHQGRTARDCPGKPHPPGARAHLRRSASRPVPGRPVRGHRTGRHRPGGLPRCAISTAGRRRVGIQAGAYSGAGQPCHPVR